MTVEFAAAFPVLIVVAVVAVNALTFFSECAAFDNAFREAVRISATSPAYGQSAGQSAAAVEEGLRAAFDADNESLRVTASAVSGGHTEFSATLDFEPTLFGMGLRTSVLGVSLPPLSHTATVAVDCYKPGVLL